MSAFLYGVMLQWKLDIRSKSLLITCYLVPLLFFLLMGGIFTSAMPEMKTSLVQSMCTLGVSMAAFVGLPPTLAETYGSDVQKVYKTNGVPLYLGVIAICLSAFLHLTVLCTIILLAAPVLFGASLPDNLLLFYVALSLLILVSVGVGSVIGLAVKSQAKLTMIEQLVFLPSIMLSGILFPVDLLPGFLKTAGGFLPASRGYELMLDRGFRPERLWYFLIAFFAAVLVCGILLHRRRSK